MHPAILFEPDGYLTTGPRLMGRQSAGDGFLRAAVKARGDDPLAAYTPSPASAEAFRARVAELDPAAQTRWIPARRLDLLGPCGVLYRPDHVIDLSARSRLRVGADQYSLCGVTHTLASGGALDQIADMAVAPIMPWDAVICTSSAAVSVIHGGLDTQADYLKWRFGCAVTSPRPLTPLIPLGVHCEDYAFTAEDRAAARADSDIADDEVVALFAGRFSINGKAHPYPMYRALQAAAQATGRRIAILHAGQFVNQDLENAFRSAAARFCPDVRCIFLDGKDPALYRGSWAAADIFITLSDSIQETFGLTPVEAMAAGLPVLVTDWNGYKDTIRDGIDGFRIATWQPAAGAGEPAGRDHEVGTASYDLFLSRMSSAVAVDMRALVARLTDLVVDGDLRRRMGAAGRSRAREIYDWSVIYGRYQALWAELNAIRRRDATSALLHGAPRSASGRRDPFEVFGHYSTHTIRPDTPIAAAADASLSTYESLAGHPILAHWKLPAQAAQRIFAALAAGAPTVAALAQGAGISPDAMAEIVGRLAKMGLIDLG